MFKKQSWRITAAASLLMTTPVIAQVADSLEAPSRLPPEPRPLVDSLDQSPSEPMRMEPIEPFATDANGALPQVELSANVLSVEYYEQTALASNPAVAEAAANLEAAKWRCYQARLRNNPSAGYTASEVGNEGQAGQQGFYVQQTVTPRRKRWSRIDVAAREVEVASQQLAIQQQRVLTDVRRRFIAVVIAQTRIDTMQRLLEVSTKAADSAQRLFASGETPKADYLQTRLDADRMRLELLSARQQLDRNWRSLNAVAGMRNSGPAQPLTADIDNVVHFISYDEALPALLQASPEVAKAMANIQRARSEVHRQRMEVIPDVTANVSVQYDNATQYTVTGIQAGMPLPILDRNQGNIGSACSQLTAAQQQLERLELRLQQDLASAHADYANAYQRVMEYQKGLLPSSKETRDLVVRAFQQGEIGFLQLLNAQRTFFQVSLDYLDELENYWARSYEIDGMLLTGSLDQD